MFRNARIYSLIALLTVTMICVPILAAEAGDPAGPPEPAHHAGFFETNYVLTEIICLIIFAITLAIAMASDTTYQRVETQHWDFFNKPLGKSVTQIPVPKEPSSPQEIRNALLILGVVYLILRLTCLSGCCSSIYQLIGDFIDITFGC